MVWFVCCLYFGGRDEGLLCALLLFADDCYWLLNAAVFVCYWDAVRCLSFAVICSWLTGSSLSLVDVGCLLFYDVRCLRFAGLCCLVVVVC